MPDPNIQQAMDEIEAILRRHDLGGVAFLVSPSHSHYHYFLSPSWSCAYFTQEGELRVKALIADFKTPAQQHKVVESTAHMVYQIRDLNALSFTHMGKIIDLLEQHYEVTHTPYAGLEPGREF